MIKPEFQDKNNVQDTTSDSVEIQYSISGFIVNIFIVLFWLYVMSFSFYAFAITEKPTLDFFGPIIFMALWLIVFHLYALVDPEYTNKKEYQKYPSLENVLKNHWAIVSGTCLFFLSPIYFGFDCFNSKHFWKVLLIDAVPGMVCLGFITNNNKHILARIVRPWQSHEKTKVDTVNV